MAGLIIALLLPSLALTDCGRAVTAPARAQSVRAAPERLYAVGVRTLTLGRGTARPLTVTIWYPATGRPPALASPAPCDPGGTPAAPSAPGGASAEPSPSGGASATPKAPVAPGRFPLVLFSHGLNSLPELHAPLTVRWAAAGFVVAAPAYPHTRRGARSFSRADVRNQPADGWRVIHQVLRLNAVNGDPFAGHLDAGRIAAAGHSAGGYTTAGLFNAGHSAQLRAGIIIAGGDMPGAFSGPPGTLLFVHGGADPTVSSAKARATYDRLRWPKAFLSLPRQGHADYLRPGRPGFDQVARATTDFLRWTLYGDAAGRRRLAVDAGCPGVTEFAGQL